MIESPSTLLTLPNTLCCLNNKFLRNCVCGYQVQEALDYLRILTVEYDDVSGPFTTRIVSSLVSSHLFRYNIVFLTQYGSKYLDS